MLLIWWGYDGHWHIWTIDPGEARPCRSLAGLVIRISLPGRPMGGISTTRRLLTAARIVTSGACPAAEARLEQVTRTGSGAKAYEWGGTYLVYQRQNGDSPLLLLPLKGGPTRELSPCAAAPSSFNVGPQGVYYVGCEQSTIRSVH